MSVIVEINEDGTLQLPGEVLAAIQPHKRFVVEVNQNRLILSPDHGTKPFWETATPEERAERLLQWATTHKNGPGLPDEAMHRDTMYD